MKPIDFVENKLRNLASKFEGIQIRYEYRSNTRSHLIEVIPLSFFEGNTEYFREETNIEDEFEHLFPNESIVFISESSLTEIKHAHFELGYNKIKFDNVALIIEFIVEGYPEIVDSKGFNNYALAA
ncbi:MAG: hypothetical protein WCX48_03260 [Bacteroidales bacterium]